VQLVYGWGVLWDRLFCRVVPYGLFSKIVGLFFVCSIGGKSNIVDHGIVRVSVLILHWIFCQVQGLCHLLSIICLSRILL
jgi:hypothetical protein